MTEPPYTIPSTEIQYVWFIPTLDNGRLELSDKVLAILETAARAREDYRAKEAAWLPPRNKWSMGGEAV